MMVGADEVFIGAPSQIPCAKTDSPPERVQGAGEIQSGAGGIRYHSE